MASRLVLFILCLALTLLGIIPAPLLAQSADLIFINYAEATDAQDHLQVDIYFNLLDNDGRVAPRSIVREASIVLDDGTITTASISQPQTPFYIALVLDASGSMIGALPAMQQAAAAAVRGAPNQAEFAVIEFNEQTRVLQDFTDNTDQVIRAINEVRPIDQRGTCLYDAVYQAVERMDDLPLGRRAVIVMTDGRDETAAGTVCSSRRYDEVVDLAVTPALRVPVHVIGLRGSASNPINETDLRNLASSTGGVAAIGNQADLGDLFNRVITAINSQWMASASIYPRQGRRTATLLVTLQDGAFPQPAVTTLLSPRTYTQATPTPVEAPAVADESVTIELGALRLDASGENLIVSFEVDNASRISQYRFELKDSRTNLLQGEFRLDAPVNSPISLPVSNLPRGQYTVTATIVDQNGRTLDRSDAVSFVYAPTTPTPEADETAVTPTPTSTPAPGVAIDGISFDADNNAFQVSLLLAEATSMSRLETRIVNARTGLLEESREFEVADVITLALEPGALEPGDYHIVVIAKGANGETTGQDTERVTYDPVLPSPDTVEMRPSIEQDSNTNELVIEIELTNESLVEQFELEIVNNETGFKTNAYLFDAPPYDSVRIPLSELEAGDYTLTLRALGANQVVLSEQSLRGIYRPPTPTPEPTATPTPTPPEFPSRIWFTENAATILPVVAVILVVLIGLLLLIARPKKKTSAGIWDETSTSTDMDSLIGEAKTAGEYTDTDDPSKTNPVRRMDPNVTNPIRREPVPEASLSVVQSVDTARANAVVRFSHQPFRIGRSGKTKQDLTFEHDDNISREHLVITYENGAFYVTDLGSTHGTTLNGRMLPAHTPVLLESGALILLGTGTTLRFQIDAPKENR